MTIALLTPLLPLLVISAGILILMLQIAFFRSEVVSWLLTCLIIVLTMASTTLAVQVAPIQVTPLLIIDHLSIFICVVLLFTALVTGLLSRGYWQHRAGQKEEFYLLLLCSTTGAMVLVCATHLASLMLGLELMGIALYGLIAYPERGDLPLEAAIKYLVLSGAASAILLFGFALIYAGTGALSFSGIAEALTDNATAQQLPVIAGMIMVLIGLAFKLSLVPFHMWTPDAYQGAPAPVAGFLATVSKAAVFVALLRLLDETGLYSFSAVSSAMGVLAVISMLVGNWLALKQQNLSRLMAYSSIAHMGYLFVLIALLNDGQDTVLIREAGIFYIVAYVISTLAVFSVMSVLSSNSEAKEYQKISDFEGLFWRNPLLALVLTAAVLSLAGIPLTAGFIAKFYILSVGAKASAWVLLSVLVIGSGIGIYYYLRVIFALTQSKNSGQHSATVEHSIGGGVLLMLLFLIIVLGVMPETFIDYLGVLAHMGT